MSIDTEKSDNLTLQGRLSIGNAQVIYDKIRTLLKTPNCLNIYLSEIHEIDLAFLQILYSLLSTAHKNKKRMSVFIDNPGKIKDLISKAGFETLFSITADPRGTCFQIEGIYQ